MIVGPDPGCTRLDGCWVWFWNTVRLVVGTSSSSVWHKLLSAGSVAWRRNYHSMWVLCSCGYKAEGSGPNIPRGWAWAFCWGSEDVVPSRWSHILITICKLFKQSSKYEVKPNSFFRWKYSIRWWFVATLVSMTWMSHQNWKNLLMN